MPNCFTLTKKGESEPKRFVEIDEEICAYLEVPCDPVHWVFGWYDIIGLYLALGKTFEEIDGELYGDKLKLINKWLQEHYTSDAWAERGGRR